MIICVPRIPTIWEWWDRQRALRARPHVRCFACGCKGPQSDWDAEQAGWFVWLWHDWRTKRQYCPRHKRDGWEWRDNLIRT